MLVPGVSQNGTLAGAQSDHELCFGDADVAYVFTIDVPSGVIITAGGDFADLALSLLDSVTCELGENPAEDRTCVDEQFFFDDQPERIRIGELQPGTYYLVVDGSSFDGPFTVNLNVSEPFCVGDEGDEFARGDPEVVGNETAASALTLADGFATGDVDTAAGFEQGLCEGDVDYWLVGHLGGALSIATTADAAAGFELIGVNVNVDETIATNALVYTEGDVLQNLPITTVDIPAGFYLVKATEQATLVGAERVNYSFAVTHACVGDRFDVPDLELDRFFELQQDPIVLPSEPQDRSVCAADVDYVVIDALFDGEAKAIISGVDALNVEFAFFTVDELGATTPVDTVRTEVGATAEFTATVAAGRLEAHITGGGFIETRTYAIAIVPPGMGGVPENDTCATATTLVSGETVNGRTFGGDDSAFTACSDGDATDAPADVFYRFTVLADVDTRVRLTSLEGFDGTFGVYRLEAGCPASPTALVPVAVGGSDVCGDRFEDVFEIPALAAGEYILMVEDPAFSFGVPGGIFQVTMEQFADGFPPPAACQAENVRPLSLPAIGSSTTVDFVAADFFPNELSDWGLCSGRGDEVVYEIVSPVRVQLTIETSGTADMVLALLNGTCEEAAVTDCDDDSSEAGNNSLLVATLEANEVNYLVVDHFSSFSDSADGSFTIAAATAP